MLRRSGKNRPPEPAGFCRIRAVDAPIPTVPLVHGSTDPQIHGSKSPRGPSFPHPHALSAPPPKTSMIPAASLPTRLFGWIPLPLTTLLLAACGGGGDDAGTPATETPTVSAVSVDRLSY